MSKSLLLSILSVSAITLVLGGCATTNNDRRAQVQPGMTQESVDRIMGPRDSFSSNSKDGATFTVFQYLNRTCNANVSLTIRCDYFIVFRDGKVVETGVRNERQTLPRM